VFSDEKLKQDFYVFLREIFHLYPENKFHRLIEEACREKDTDEEIYNHVQSRLPGIKPFLSELTYALPALRKQKKEMARQVMELITPGQNITGYLEIGSTGRYISELRRHLIISGNIFLSNDIAPENSVADFFERGQLRNIGKFIPLNNYAPIDQNDITSNSIDMVTCHIGLHHCPPALLQDYLQSIHRVLRKGGWFILRDHDVKTPGMAVFVSLVHTVFNLGLNVPWETDSSEFKSFRPVEEWSSIIAEHGMKDSGKRILQQNDPSQNTLLSFIKS
jgi:SAM-dependent methyltransferase